MATQQVHAVIYKDAESDQWVAECLEYGVASQGDSEQHACEMIKEAVELYLEEVTQDELERLYQPLGSEPKIHQVVVEAGLPPMETPEGRPI